MSVSAGFVDGLCAAFKFEFNTRLIVQANGFDSIRFVYGVCIRVCVRVCVLCDCCVYAVCVIALVSRVAIAIDCTLIGGYR